MPTEEMGQSGLCAPLAGVPVGIGDASFYLLARFDLVGAYGHETFSTNHTCNSIHYGIGEYHGDRRSVVHSGVTGR